MALGLTRSGGRGGSIGRRPRSTRSLFLAFVACLSAALIGGVTSYAFVGDGASKAAAFSAGRIFPGVRTTTAFQVSDRSGGGAAVDRSSPLAFAGDGLSMATGVWSSAFSTARYVQFDLNAGLPGGVAVSSASLVLSFASSNPSGTSCIYVEVRRASTDAVQATYGSAASPLGCVAGTTFATLSQSIGGGSSDLIDDLRIRLYGRDSAGAGSRVDQAVVNGSTPDVSFTLYAARTTDAANGVPVTAPWSLAGP
jgi:hypothetical protein